MKVLVLFGLIAATLAVPLPEAEADADNVVVAHHAAVSPYAFPTGHFGHFAHGAVAPSVYAGGHFAHGAVAPAAYAGHFAHGAVAPSVYAAGHFAHGAVAPSVYAAGHFAHAAVAPAAVAPVAVAPAAVAPAAVAYAHAPVAVAHSLQAHPVALPPAQVKVPVTTYNVQVPIHQQVQYGTQAYVAGATTTIHKPSLAAPAIAPPSTLLAKVHHAAPEVTLKIQEIPVQRNIPNYVETPYHAGTIIKYTAPEIREIKVPTPVAQPVAVPHPVPYAAPYPVPHAVPVPHPIHTVNVHHPAVNVLQHPAVVKVDI